MMNLQIAGDLSPAYDLTYSNTYYGEHTTTVDGNGRNPGKKELLCSWNYGWNEKRTLYGYHN